MPTTLLHPKPKNELQAKFSMQFSMAILALRRRAGLDEYTDEIVTSPEVQAMIEKVDFHVHPEAEAAGYDKMTSIVEIHLKGGKTVTGRADFGKGSPANPMSWREVIGKFTECCEYGGLPTARIDEIVSMVEGLPSLKNVRDLTRALTM
jgi:2-methylcitrate dehydratase PrpD